MRVRAANPLATSISLLLVIGLIGCGSDTPEVTSNQNKEMAAEPILKDEMTAEPNLLAESATDVPELITEDINESLQEAEESAEQYLDTVLDNLDDSGQASSEPMTGDSESAKEEGLIGWQEDSGSPEAESLTESQTLTAKADQQIQAPESLNEVVKVTPEIIRKVQQALSDAGFNPGAIDGIKGPRTMSALKEFQKQNNLAVGQFTKETLQKLDVNY